MLERFSFFKKRTFRLDFRATMSYLLGYNNELLDALLTKYPGVWTGIDKRFSEGETVTYAGTAHLLTVLFVQEIEQSIPAADYANIEKYILRNEDVTVPRIARGIKMFLSQVTVQQTLGKIDEYFYGYIISEIIGSLRGIPANERSGNRVAASFARYAGLTVPTEESPTPEKGT
jgi:hypothetical protein